MAGKYNIYKNVTGEVGDIANWERSYKDAFINQTHDQSQLNLILPDDCLVVIGAPRLADADENYMFPVGYLNSIQWSETRQVQPLKSIGSRRHIFAATNSPIQGSIARLLFVGDNLLYALHKLQEIPDSISQEGTQHYFAGTLTNDDSGSKYNRGDWHVDVEEDLFRIPFGLGIIYNSPATAAQSTGRAAEYLEGCVLTGKNITLQSGQAMIMEQVSFMADRVVGWNRNV